MLRTRELGAAEGVPVGCADGAEGLLVGCSEGDDGLPVGCPDGSPVGDSTCCFPFVLRLVLGFLLPLALVLGSALTKLWLLCITIAKTKKHSNKLKLRRFILLSYTCKYKLSIKCGYVCFENELQLQEINVVSTQRNRKNISGAC
jgi:hypothetical protein